MKSELTYEVVRNPSQLSDLYRDCRPKLYHRALAMVRSPELAEDMVHDTFMKAIATAQEGYDILDLEAWLMRVIHNQCVDYIRGQHRHKTESFEEAAPTREVIESMDPHELHERCQTIGKAVRSLPKAQRSALLLTATQGLAYQEVAERMHVSIGSVRQLLFRARASIRAAVGTSDMPLLYPTLTLQLAVEESRLNLHQRVGAAAIDRFGELQAWASSLLDRGAAMAPSSVAALVAAPLLMVSIISAVVIPGAGQAPTAGKSPATDIANRLLPDPWTSPVTTKRSRADGKSSHGRSANPSKDRERGGPGPAEEGEGSDQPEAESNSPSTGSSAGKKLAKQHADLLTSNQPKVSQPDLAEQPIEQPSNIEQPPDIQQPPIEQPSGDSSDSGDSSSDGAITQPPDVFEPPPIEEPNDGMVEDPGQDGDTSPSLLGSSGTGLEE